MDHVGEVVTRSLRSLQTHLTTNIWYIFVKIQFFFSKEWILFGHDTPTKFVTIPSLAVETAQSEAELVEMNEFEERGAKLVLCRKLYTTKPTTHYAKLLLL